MRSDPPRRRAGAILAAALIAAMIIATVGAFAASRVIRSADDLVHSVRIDRRLDADGTARIAFKLASPSADVDVLLVDASDRVVRTLGRDAFLAARRHVYRWDGRRDDGKRADPGRYSLRVVLGEEDRDISPPGTVRVPARD